MPRRKFRLTWLLFTIVVMLFVTQVTAAQQPLKDTLGLMISDVYNQGNVALLDLILADNYIRHPLETSREEFKIAVAALRSAIPDLHAQIEVSVAESELVATRLRLRGNFTNPYILPNIQPLMPNNRQVEFVVNTIYRFNETGQIAEEWVGFDSLSFQSQMAQTPIGVAIPLPEVIRFPDVVDVGMSPQNRSVVQAYFDALNQGNLAFIDVNFKFDFISHNPFGTMGREDLVGDLSRLRAALPDLTVSLERLVTEGNWTVAQYGMRGTFTQNYTFPNGASVPPTNRPLDLSVVTFFRFEQQGLVAEYFEVYDSLGFLSQLGLLNLVVPGASTP